MTYLMAGLIVVGAAIAAALGSAVVNRLLAVEARRSRHDVGGAVFAQIGILYSVLLAFVFSEVWGEYNVAAQAISAECGALHGAAMLAAALPSGEGQPIVAAVIDYDRSVVASEWPAMARRDASPQATASVQALLAVAARLDLARPGDLAVRGQILSLLTDAHAARETRTFQVTQGLPAAVWAVLITLAALLILFVLFSGLEYPVHTWFCAAFAGCIVLVLVLVRMLDYPFEGALALDPADFAKLLGQTLTLARLG